MVLKLVQPNSFTMLEIINITSKLTHVFVMPLEIVENTLKYFIIVENNIM
jgi:hypothetical protein